MTVRANITALHQASTSSISSTTATSSSASSNSNGPDFASNRIQQQRINTGENNYDYVGTSWVNNYQWRIMVQCFASGSHSRRGSVHFIRRLEKVKFGVPLSEAFSHNIPATLLVLLLKVNKQGPAKRDIWRAPGNQAQVRKLIYVMQHGRLVNIENYSVYTAASVIKKFLAKIPGGIFGPVNEERLFELLNFDDPDKQRDAFCRVVSSLPVPSQHFLVLLFGTFRLIADSAESHGTRMSVDAIGVSVAPSLFHTCIHDGQKAKMEDIARFHMASKILSFLVQNFGYTNLFPRDNYEFYARITGRTLRVDEKWQFSFQFPSKGFGSQSEALTRPEQPDSPSPPPEEQRYRYRNSAELAGTTVSLDELKRINKLAESTKSLTYLEWVHERQTQRMQSRSEWFLSLDPSQSKRSIGPITIDTSSPTTPHSPRYFSARHGSLPVGSAYDQSAGPSYVSSTVDTIISHHPHPPRSPLQYYRYHHYNPQHRGHSASISDRIRFSPTTGTKLRPVSDSSDQEEIETIELHVAGTSTTSQSWKVCDSTGRTKEDHAIEKRD